MVRRLSAAVVFCQRLMAASVRTILPNNTLPGCGNPSPWVNGDGSILIACDTYYDDANHSTLVKILRAPSIAGPWCGSAASLLT